MSEQEIIKEAFQEEIPASDIIHTSGKYTNIYFRDYRGFKGLKPGQFVTVNKHGDYLEPKTLVKEGPYGPYNIHMCNLTVDGTDVSFVTFDDKESESFVNTGGLGDKIQISKKKYTYLDKKGVEKVKEELVFRKAQ